MTDTAPSDLDPDQYLEVARAITREIGRVIVGQDDVVRQVLICLLCEGHLLLEGVPGLGKTQLLKTLATAGGVEFSRIQFTPDLMPADILGTQVLEEDAGGHRRFQFRAGPLFANLVLADEVNRATPKTQSALLESMQERTATIAGETRALPRPFLVMATQNPIEMEGTYPLPEAQLDRFMFKVLVQFPEPEELAAIVHRTTGGSTVTPRKVADETLLTEVIALTREVPVARHLVGYAARLVLATHPNRPEAPDAVRSYVRIGSSPRGAQAMVLAAKASALLDGRPNVSAEDIRSVAHAALRHRLLLGYEASADDVTSDSIVDAVLARASIPSAGLRGAP
jgi:MoxR-like ATPase